MTRLDSATAARAESQPHHRDTPPEDVYVVEAGLLARGSVLLSGLPETFSGLSDFVGQPLAAYSCGGSSGFGHYGRTGFPLSFGKTLPEEPRRLRVIDKCALQSTDHFLCGNPCGTMVWTME